MLPRQPAHEPRRRIWVGLWAAGLVTLWRRHSTGLTFAPAPRALGLQHQRNLGRTRVVRSAGVQDSIVNPVKTVADTIKDFYKAYPQPPVLPMYRGFLIDFLTQTHLVTVDSRYKYDAIFALGLKEYYSGVMGAYDKLVGGPESEKIWKAFISSLGMDPDTVTADADAVSEYAKSTAPADILKQMEGAETASEEKVGQAFKSIGSSLYSFSFSVGLFKMMELCGVDVSKANVEEWAKAMKIKPTKSTSDLETYKINKNKLQKAEEMLREVEIREKKKLAERLEEKAKALAAKAAEKKAAAAAAETAEVDA